MTAQQEREAFYAWHESQGGGMALGYAVTSPMGEAALQAWQFRASLSLHRSGEPGAHATVIPVLDELLKDIAKWRRCTSLPRKIEECGSIGAFNEFAADLWKRFDSAVASLALPSSGDGWQDIATAPHGREMFVVKAFNVSNGFTGGKPYTSDPWCVWQYEPGKFARWPHNFQPTHWLALPAAMSQGSSHD